MLSHLKLKNYRNLSREFELGDQANLIVAPNGSGKSNFLEAINFAASLQLFRPYQDWSDIIGEKAEFASIILNYQSTELETIISRTADGIARTYKVNGKATSAGKFRHRFAVTLFAPHSVDLISEDPAQRRTDLDTFIASLQPEHADTFDIYEKILKHRNALLRELSLPIDAASQSQLLYWDQELLRLSCRIYELRVSTLNALATELEVVRETLFPNSQMRLEYVCKLQPDASDPTPSSAFDYGATLQQKLSTNQEKEIASGQSLYGVHRDDWYILLDERNVRYLGSRGQQRLAVLAWKLAQYQLQKHQNPEQPPVLLLDDIFSELDAQKREFVSSYLLDVLQPQFIMTTIESNEVPESLLAKAKRLTL